MNEITEDQYRKLKREVETAKSEAERARGAFEQVTSRLKSEFGCASIKEAKAKLLELEEVRDTAQQEFSSALDAYQKRWK